MTVSIYSFLAALFWFDLVVLVCRSLRANKHFSYQFGLWPLGAALAAGCLRLVCPFEFSSTVVIHSLHLFPAIRDMLMRIYILGERISFSGCNFLLVCWMIGICVGFLRLAVLLRKDYNSIHQLAAIPDQRIQTMITETVGTTNFRFIMSLNAETPAMAGLFTPVFILPQYISRFSDSEVRCILQHEWQHFLHHDAWIKLMTEVVICCFWWNPPVHLLRRDLDQFLEVNCDLSITKDMDSAERAAYLETIKKSLLFQHDKTSASIVFSRLFFVSNSYDIKQRFRLVQNYNKKRNFLVIGGYCILLSFIWFLSMLFVVQPASYPSDLEIISMETDRFEAGVNGVDGMEGTVYFKQADNGRYVLYVNGKPGFDYSEEEFSVHPFNQLPIIK